ncbi:MAG TPA: pantetheine-phosphate adenylyltransferase [Acidobacteriota bacterium]|nr:pantetheine-phosphate adenylyltransferase [Acidobacteriota bacterium]
MRIDVTAIYPGSFDPVTNGHLDIIERGSSIFTRVVVAVLLNEKKKPLFSVEERLAMLNQVTAKWANVEVDRFEGLLVNYAVQKEARVILRGIRAVTDFDYEFQMALMNRRMQPDLETVFLMPAEAYSYLSSSLVKEVYQLGGSVKGLVPIEVEKALREKLRGAPGSVEGR